MDGRVNPSCLAEQNNHTHHCERRNDTRVIHPTLVAVIITRKNASVIHPTLALHGFDSISQAGLEDITLCVLII